MHLDRTHKKLDARKVTLELCEEVYVFCERLPPEERYGLGSQMRRAAVSVPSNISEGAARGTTKELCHYLTVAQASLAGLDT